ncbi:MAG: Glucose/mannose:H+ symporter GlcP, partial [uncultured Lysobacter sp.]
GHCRSNSTERAARLRAGRDDFRRRRARRLPVRVRHRGDQWHGRFDPQRVRIERRHDRVRGVVRAARLGTRCVVRRAARRPLRPRGCDEDRGAAAARERDRFGPRVRRVGPDLLAHRRRRRRRHGLGARAHVHRRSRARACAWAAGFDAADGDRARHLRRAAGRCVDRRIRRRCVEAVAARPGGLALDVPVRGAAGGALRRAGVHVARVAAPPGRERPFGRGARRARRGPRPARRPGAGRQARRYRTQPADGPPPAPGRPARTQLRPASGGVDRYCAVGVPAVRRHQRDFLLLLHAVALGRFQRSRFTDDHGRDLDRERAGDAGRDRAGRQGRAQAAAGGRLGRHGGDAGADGLGVLARGRQRRGRRVAGQLGADRTDRGEPVRGVLRPELGAGGVGAAGRDVPEPHPRDRARGRGRRAVAGELRDHQQLPGNGGTRPDVRVWRVCGLRAAVAGVRDLWRARNAWHGAGGYARL